MDSDTFKPTGITWQENTVTYGTSASCKANRTDDGQDVAEAEQWNTQNKMLPDDTDLPPALKNIAFLRGGDRWNNNIDIDFGGGTFSSVQLSFRNNAATRGDAQGTIPVYDWSGVSLTGTKTLTVTLNQPGDYLIGL